MQSRLNKIIKYAFLTLFLAFFVVLGNPNNTYADINGAEGQVLGAAGSVFYYDGDYYMVYGTYINQLANALDTQYDLTQDQANACIDYMYNNVAAGIEGGYLYKLENNDTPQDSESTGGKSETKPESTGNSNVVMVDPNSGNKSKDQLLRETTDLASDMGINIKYDSSNNEISITDKSGNVLISTKKAVKNTGFRLNSLVIYIVLLVTLVIAVAVAAFKLKLFEHDYGDEDAQED